jgi:hypothetical protein
MKRVILPLLIIISILVNAQEKQDFGIKFSGFVKSDFFYDTRQNVSIREGHFLLYPSPIVKDVNGSDINSQGNFNFLSIQSRLTGKITGPDAFGAKTTGLLEADFFGNETSNVFADVNGFRLRHAYAKMNWAKTELLFGQYWNPLFVANCFPGVISFNTGAPFQAFSRNPQIRATQKIGDFSIIAAVASQRDFTSPGGSTALRNSGIPDMHFQIQWGIKNDSTNTEFLAGIGGEYKIIRPRLNSEKSTTVPESYSIDTTISPWHITHTNAVTTTKKYKVDETLGTYTAIIFAKVKVPVLTAKIYGLYGQNTYDLVMLGGYAVDTICDANTGKLDYTPVNILSTWLDLSTNGKKIQYALFAGYTKNMGVDKELGFKNNSNIVNALKSTSRGYDIESIIRVAPRVVFIAGKLQLTVEVEYTSASYATTTNNKLDIDRKGKITKSESVSNIRGLFAVIYNF